MEKNTLLEQVFYLGVDLSTQSLKGLIIDGKCRVVFMEKVIFSKELPHYKTENGVLHLENGEIVSPTIMFIEALDILLGKIKKSPIPIHKIAALSGSGQQHGSVYWNQESEKALMNLNPNENFLPQLENKLFSSNYSPLWMDSTTTKYCQELEEKFGEKNLCSVTGSKAFERFTGNQIKKLYVEKKEIYEKTKHISLISSFVAEIFLGKFAPMDFSDACGMNLFDIKLKTWNEELINICGGPSLKLKLMDPVPSYKSLGKINEYFVNRYGFNENCDIIAFSGDNPCSLIGSGILKPGIIGISLGTSDTIFSLIDKNEAKCNFDGHLFVSPTDENLLMMMVCMKNGALVREKYKKLYYNDDWTLIEKALKSSQPGNNGVFGFFFEYPEISPAIKVENFCLFKNKHGEEVSFEQKGEVIRAVYESKAFLLKLALEKFGTSKVEKIVVSGGSSKCEGFLQIISDVFNSEIYTLENPETAAYGAALRAFHGETCQIEGKILKIEELIGTDSGEHKLVARPNKEAHLIYQEIVRIFAVELESLIKKYSVSNK